jgi:RNA polymerase-binding protein DksA
MWGIAMAERTAAVRKASKSANAAKTDAKVDNAAPDKGAVAASAPGKAVSARTSGATAKKAAAASKAAPATKAPPAKKAAPAKAAAKQATKAAPAKAGSTKAAPAAKTAPATKAAPAKKTAAVRTTPQTTADAPKTAAKSAAKGATMAKTAETKTATRKAAPAPARAARSAAETEKIRAALAARRDELRTEYDSTISEINELQRDRLTDSAGDDQADTGTKTGEREQEISIANSILERITQVERALERLDDGQYGWCERCGNAIPVERLAAFPSATLCVTCKQLEERR